jgi:hypothetical protein
VCAGRPAGGGALGARGRGRRHAAHGGAGAHNTVAAIHKLRIATLGFGHGATENGP